MPTIETIRAKIEQKVRNFFMAKNAASGGRSARRGRSPSPYTKYGKVPHRYSPAYYQWKDAMMRNKPTKHKEAGTKKEYLKAA